MAFQAIIDAELHEVSAYEALVRGMLQEGAAHVLSHVNDQNLYAFDQACRVKAITLAAHLGLERRLNINFLPNAVYDPRACIRATLNAAASAGFDLGKITFEIVESERIADTAHLQAIIKEYRRNGFLIALDDFGTGYADLLRLLELKPDVIKIDRALVQNCSGDEQRLAVLARLIDLSAELGAKVVVEGVETMAEYLALRSVGARFMQGYLFSRPLFEKLASREEAFVFLSPPGASPASNPAG